jgi:hypothetical protein
MSIEWWCVQCGKEGFTVIDLTKDVPNIISLLKSLGWIVQFNGDCTDIYCCKNCAL